MDTQGPSPRSRLVDDLIPIVFDHLANDTAHVAPLALVSFAWLVPARRVLYSAPRLLTYHACYLLSRTLASNPSLGDKIHELYIHPASRLCEDGAMCACRKVPVLAMSLTPLFRLSNLTIISLGSDCALRAEWYLRSFASPQNVREVRVEGLQRYWSVEEVQASIRWNETLVSRFTNLKRLNLVNLDLRICEPRAFDSPSPHIEFLHLDGVRITYGKLSELAYRSWEALQELTVVVHECKTEYDLQTILSEASQSLRTFRYFTKESAPQQDLNASIDEDALASCHALHTLELSLPFSLSTLSNLGQRLVHLEVLRIYGNYDITVAEWAAVISTGVFPSLRELHLPIGYELKRLADWPYSYSLQSGEAKSVRQECTARGISLQFGYLVS